MMFEEDHAKIVPHIKPNRMTNKTQKELQEILINIRKTEEMIIKNDQTDNYY